MANKSALDPIVLRPHLSMGLPFSLSSVRCIQLFRCSIYSPFWEQPYNILTKPGPSLHPTRVLLRCDAMRGGSFQSISSVDQFMATT
jgi:hypothetical protein